MSSSIGGEEPSNAEAARIDALDVRSIVDTVREPLLVLDGELRVQSANRSFYRTFRVLPQETEGQLLYDLGNRQWDIPRLHTLLEEVLPQNTAFDDFELTHDFPDIGRKVMLLNARRLPQEEGDRILLAIEDVTERRRLEVERQEIETRFTALVKNVKDHSIFTLDPEGRVTSWNVAAQQILGYSEAEVLGRHFSFIFTPEDCEQGMPEVELREARECGRAEDERWHLRKGGEPFWALGIVSALHDAEGRLIGFSKILRDMTAWKQAEQNMQASDLRLRRMLNVDGVGVLIFDNSGTLIDANDAFLKMTGYGRGEVEARALTWRVMTPPEHVAESERQVRLLAASGRVGPYEKEYFHKDGSRSWMFFTGASLGDGTVIEYCIDIDDRKHAEEALRQSERRLRLALDRAYMVAFEWDIPRDEVRRQHSRLEAAPATPEERPSTLEEFVAAVHPDDRERFVANLDSTLAHPERGYQAEYRLCEPDGRILWLSEQGYLECNEQGKPERLIGLIQDVTERKQAEVALRESEERLKLATDATELGVFEWDLSSDRVTANDHLRVWYGVGSREPMTGAHFLRGCVHASDRMFVEEQVRQAMDPRSSGRYSFEYRLVQPDTGRERWILTHGKVYFEGAGDDRRPVRVFGTNLDVTDRKRSEARLKESDRRKDAFLATLAHELRNPLAPIRTGLDLIRALRCNAPACDEPVRIMDRQLSHLVRLVDDLLDVSRVSRGKIQLRKERLDLAEIIHAALEMSESGLSHGNRQLTVSLASEPLVVEGDPVRLVQVIANLLNNAGKFTEAGGRIDIRVTPQGEWVEIQVQDDGRGIPRERLDHIFEMFSQAEPGVGGGLGIGLSLVRGLVEMHGGTVGADSAGPGCGATFTVSLPLGGSVPVQATAEPATEPGALPIQCRVLVVDDNPDIVESLRLLLTMLGAEVRVAHDGAEAIRAFDEWPPTHVLMDLGMPGMDGYEAARRLRAKHADHPSRLIAMTGWGQEEDRQRTRDAGFDEHLVKPVRLEKLKEVLST